MLACVNKPDFFLLKDQVSLAFLKPASLFQPQPRFCGNAIRSDLLPLWSVSAG